MMTNVREQRERERNEQRGGLTPHFQPHEAPYWSKHWLQRVPAFARQRLLSEAAEA